MCAHNGLGIELAQQFVSSAQLVLLFATFSQLEKKISSTVICSKTATDLKVVARFSVTEQKSNQIFSRWTETKTVVVVGLISTFLEWYMYAFHLFAASKVVVIYIFHQGVYVYWACFSCKKTGRPLRVFGKYTAGKNAQLGKMWKLQTHRSWGDCMFKMIMFLLCWDGLNFQLWSKTECIPTHSETDYTEQNTMTLPNFT